MAAGEKGGALQALVVAVVYHKKQRRNEFWAYRCQLDPQFRAVVGPKSARLQLATRSVGGLASHRRGGRR